MAKKSIGIDYTYFRSCYGSCCCDESDAPKFDDPFYDKLNADYARLHPVDEHTGSRVSDLEVMSSTKDPITYNLLRSSLAQSSAGADCPDGMTDSELARSVLPVGINKSDYCNMANSVLRHLASADYSDLAPAPEPAPEPASEPAS